MGLFLWIVAFVLVVQLSTCTRERKWYTANVNIYPPPLLFCSADGKKSAMEPFEFLYQETYTSENDNKKKNILSEAQDRWRILTWYKIQNVELDRLKKQWSTLKTDANSEKKRSQYTRIRIMLESVEAFFFPIWLSSTKSFTEYEKWIIGCSTCQANGWEIFKQGIYVKYGNETEKGITALATAISDLRSELSTEVPYYNTISVKIPQADRDIVDLCSSVASATTMTHYACQLIVRAQSSLGGYIFSKPKDITLRSIFYGVIRRSIQPNEILRVITELFTKKTSSATSKGPINFLFSYFTTKTPSATPIGVENCVGNVNHFGENINLITFFASCPNTVKKEELEEKLSPLIKMYVHDLGADLHLFRDDWNDE